MTDWNRNDEQAGDHLDEVVQRLRDHRPEATGLELDRIKLRATARAAASRPKGSVLKSRLVVALATLGLMAGGTGGVIAAKDSNNGNGSASKSEYRPGKGCGAKESQHTGAPGQNGKKNEDKPCPPTSGPK